MPKQPLFLQQYAQWSCRDGIDSAFINTEPPTILFFNHHDNMQKVLEKAISLINTTILSIKSEYKVFTPPPQKKPPTYHVRVELTRSMPIWQTARRCPSRWKYPCRMEKHWKKNENRKSIKSPPNATTASPIQCYELRWYRRGWQWCRPEKELALLVWMYLLMWMYEWMLPRFTVCLEQPASLRLSPG